jgi:hypothetical protein
MLVEITSSAVHFGAEFWGVDFPGFGFYRLPIKSVATV